MRRFNATICAFCAFFAACAGEVDSISTREVPVPLRDGGGGGKLYDFPPPGSDASPCPDGTPCGSPAVGSWGVCLAGYCCTSCIADGVCAIPNIVTPGVCGEHGAACAADGASCANGWTCGAGNCGVCAAEKTKCGRLDGIAGWCADVGGSLACLRYDAPALSSPGCSAGCTDTAAAGAMCQGADGTGGCSPGCCPLKYAVVLP